MSVKREFSILTVSGPREAASESDPFQHGSFIAGTGSILNMESIIYFTQYTQFHTVFMDVEILIGPNHKQEHNPFIR